MSGRVGAIAAGGLVLAVIMHWYFSPHSQCLRTAGTMGYGAVQAQRSCDGENR